MEKCKKYYNILTRPNLDLNNSVVIKKFLLDFKIKSGKKKSEEGREKC
jgi:hypothetical protein